VFRVVFVNLCPGIDSQPGGIDSSESIPGFLKFLQIRALLRQGRYGGLEKFNYTVEKGYLFSPFPAGMSLTNLW
jgi:hypothetical protein